MDLQDRIESLEERIEFARVTSRDYSSYAEMYEELQDLRAQRRMEGFCDTEKDINSSKEKQSFIKKLLTWIKSRKENE